MDVAPIKLPHAVPLINSVGRIIGAATNGGNSDSLINVLAVTPPATKPVMPSSFTTFSHQPNAKQSLICL